jgi:hypothetical protein
LFIPFCLLPLFFCVAHCSSFVCSSFSSLFCSVEKDAARLGITTATALSAEEEVAEFERWQEERKQRALRRAALEEQLSAQNKSDKKSDEKSQSSSGAEVTATAAAEAMAAVAAEGSAAHVTTSSSAPSAPAVVIPEMQHIPIRRCVARACHSRDKRVLRVPSTFR